MNIPIEIVATLLAIVVAGAISFGAFILKRIDRTEKRVLVLIVMLKDRGFKIPDQGDTDRLLKANNL
jgi:hypothetical protein